MKQFILENSHFGSVNNISNLRQTYRYMFKSLSRKKSKIRCEIITGKRGRFLKFTNYSRHIAQLTKNKKQTDVTNKKKTNTLRF